jgi:hypothetical protein
MPKTTPASAEAAPYYFRYINQVPSGDVRDVLAAQAREIQELLGRVSEEGSEHRYAPDKWSIRQVVGHVNDCERVFTFRAFWFARGFDSPLPSFDEGVAARHDASAERPLGSLLDEFHEIRASTVRLFRHLPPEAWSRRGTASGNAFTVRALAYIVAGHAAHHAAILRDRYLPHAAG